MLSLEAQGGDRKGLGRSLQKRVNGFPGFGQIDRSVRHGSAMVDAVEDADADFAGNEQQRRNLLGLEIGIVPALHHVRPLPSPLDEAQLASRELVEAVRDDDEEPAAAVQRLWAF